MARSKADDLLAALDDGSDDVLRPIGRENSVRGHLMRNALREMRRNMGRDDEQRYVDEEAITDLRSRVRMSLSEQEFTAPPEPVPPRGSIGALAESVLRPPPKPKPPKPEESILEAPLLRPSVAEEDAGADIVRDDREEQVLEGVTPLEAELDQAATSEDAYAAQWAEEAATEPLPEEVENAYQHLAQPPAPQPAYGQAYYEPQPPLYVPPPYSQGALYGQSSYAAQASYQPDYGSTAFLPPPVSYAPEPPAGVPPIMSQQTAQNAESAFRQLSDTILARATGDKSLEDLTREMLRGMLRQWLDEHLPGLVEDMVREEIQRVARRGR